MKKITLLFITLFALFLSSEAYSQCTDLTGVAGPFTDFNGTFGGAPCDDGTGCPFNELGFEIWADEAYFMDNCISGHTYTFSACNGAGVGSWNPSFTIIAPSGAVDAFGLDAGSTCALTWTATEDGQYVIVVSEAGIPCNTSANTATDNGQPAITCADGDACPVCTATAVPDLINPTPADGDLTVQILPDGADLIITPFAWDEAILGNEGDHTISLGITTAGDDIGTIPFNGGGLIFTWTENTQYYWFITGTNCVGTAQSAIWTFTTATCAEIAAPACATLVSPTLDEVDVSTAEADNMTREVNLSWDAVAGAGAYRLTFDGADLGNVTDTNIDLFGLDYDTSYTWSIAPVNCFGTTTGCETRMFTTEQDPNLSVAQFEGKSLSVFPNPVKDQLTIKTELSIESVEIYNILGKQVKNISGNSILNNRVDMTSLLDGIYFLNITAEGKKQTIKVIKQ